MSSQTNPKEDTMEYGTTADILDAQTAAVDHAAEQAVQAIADLLCGNAARDAAAIVAERFGWHVVTPDADMEQVAIELAGYQDPPGRDESPWCDR
jgi:hypothetical protein